MRRDVYPMLSNALQARTEGWENPVEFSYIDEITPDAITLDVIPVGGGAKYWTWVSRGVQGHPIPMSGPRQGFSAGYTKRSRKSGKYRKALSLFKYVPKTTVWGAYGGPGTRTFYGYRRYVPWWPGIAPRHFEEQVAGEKAEQYHKLMENIVRRAVRVAQREGK